MPTKIRSTRKLCTWIIEQVNSEKYPGVIWDDEAKTMFRIPWKHAGKQDFRSNEDAAFFKAWAEYKGNPKRGSASDTAAHWKTRMRCALNKSPEFSEVSGRSQLDISEPYKVYRLVPLSEQGVVASPPKRSTKAGRQSLKRRLSESEGEEPVQVKQHVKEEEVVSGSPQLCIEDIHLGGEVAMETQEATQQIITLQTDGLVDGEELQLDMRLETGPPYTGVVQDSYQVTVHYMGREVLRRDVPGSDVRIAYVPSLSAPPTPAQMVGGRFPRVALPEPRPADVLEGGDSPASASSTSPAFRALSDLLAFMEKGVVLTTLSAGVYASRYCQGRVFWTGPHADKETHKLQSSDTGAEPALVFSKDAFNQQLELFRLHGGEPPQCGITLCFGEQLSKADDPSSKLITAQIMLPWAQQQVQEVQTFHMFQTLAASPLGELTLNLVTIQ